VNFNSLLCLEVMWAEGLKDSDFIGKTDPYAVVTFEEEVGAPKKRKTATLNNNLNPVWNAKMYFLLTESCERFRVDVYDEDIGRDDRLGHATILRREPHLRHERYEEPYPLRVVKVEELQLP